MNEKIIVKSQHHSTKKIILGFIIAGIIAFAGYILIEVMDSVGWYNNYVSKHGKDTALSYTGFDNAYDYAFDWLNSQDILTGLIIGCVIIVLGIIICAWLKTSMTITDKRVYGTASFGKRVDLPIDSISAVGTGMFKAIAVSTSSGKIAFFLIKNRDEIHKCISDLLLERQNKPKEMTTIKQEIPQSNADELKKYKDLLDSGVITQEEFDAKKKQLLGL